MLRQFPGGLPDGGVLAEKRARVMQAEAATAVSGQCGWTAVDGHRCKGSLAHDGAHSVYAELWRDR